MIEILEEIKKALEKPTLKNKGYATAAGATVGTAAGYSRHSGRLGKVRKEIGKYVDQHGIYHPRINSLTADAHKIGGERAHDIVGGSLTGAALVAAGGAAVHGVQSYMHKRKLKKDEDVEKKKADREKDFLAAKTQNSQHQINNR